VILNITAHQLETAALHFLAMCAAAQLKREHWCCIYILDLSSDQPEGDPLWIDCYIVSVVGIYPVPQPTSKKKECLNPKIDRKVARIMQPGYPFRGQ